MKLKIMKYIVLVAIVFLYCFSGFCLDGFSINTENFIKEEIPLSFVSGGLPIVEVNIEDKIYHLVLDTGADSITMAFTPAALKSISTQYIDSRKKSVDISGKIYQKRQFKIPSLSIGKIKISNLIAEEELRNFVPSDGIVGNQFLKHFNIYFDYQNLKVVLYSKDAYPQEFDLKKWQEIPFEHNEIGIILRGKFSHNKKELMFCLDTAMCSIINGKSHGLLRPQKIPRLFNKKKAYEVDSFYIEGIDFGPMSFMTLDFKEPPIDGFLGHNFFSCYKVFIDFDRKVLFIKKY